MRGIILSDVLHRMVTIGNGKVLHISTLLKEHILSVLTIKVYKVIDMFIWLNHSTVYMYIKTSYILHIYKIILNY